MINRVFVLFFLAFVSFGCSESSSEKETKSKPVLKKEEVAQTISYKTIEWNEAIQLNQKGDALFLDVRTPSEVAEGAVSGALNIPVQELDRRYSEIPKDKKLLVYCRSGRRSAAAASMLIQAGYKEVYNIRGGFSQAPAGL
jgi:rhodanese-related sulfurtransferase